MKRIKRPSNLIDWAPKDEVLIHLDLMKMAELANPASPRVMVVGFDAKMMRTNPKLWRSYEHVFNAEVCRRPNNKGAS